ncbi:uncharacterized protein PHACADRAFT_259107 [Phanerochaete carnosa HHB-10118-sp]|uniref:Uncharacterized protein n=1 Tax=Phanerochaete carnosa (strain HHB-10118-sp) TaxID=650164 RepID=K5VNB9_PHACS|nr:uncharacterized protein PHACADRAFT_259107 [Phanerochaete carnosa HHB-10118-sp]EKM52943.1 hypothetical protein PHACADRAFT_259107 [Phanerochaete carnosa HHB-10118-sp]
MERAMREAQEEFGEDDEGEGEDFDMSGQQNDEDEGSERDDENDAESEDEDDEPIQSEPMKKKDYLPEHLFASAFSQLSSEDEPKAKARSKKRAASPPTKRKRVKTSTKEIVVGSRVVRTLPSLANHPSTTTPKGFAPPRALKKFVDRSLNVRGRAKDAKLRGWERRPANIGVMKRNGPAAHFVRDD